jgi:hypothetical protein
MSGALVTLFKELFSLYILSVTRLYPRARLNTSFLQILIPFFFFLRHAIPKRWQIEAALQALELPDDTSSHRKRAM